MVQITSWNGKKTKSLRASGKKGIYTRYKNRQKREKGGIEIIKPTPLGLLVIDERGNPQKLEPKYHNYSGNEKKANEIFRNQIRKGLSKNQKKLAGL